MLKKLNLIKLISTVSLALLSPQISLSQDTNLEDIIHREYGKNQKVQRENNQYLIDNSDEETKKELTNMRALADKNYIFLLSLETLDYQKERKILFPYFVKYNGPFDIYSMTPRQLARIHLTLEALKRENFRKEVLKQRDLDVLNPQTKLGKLPTEIGGRVILNNNKSFLYRIPSKDEKRDFDEKEAYYSDRRYDMDLENSEQDNYILNYHFHARINKSLEYIGPSANPSLDPNGIRDRKCDVNSTFLFILEYGECHNIQFTSLNTDLFNVSYYGGEVTDKNNVNVNVLDLGNWSIKGPVLKNK